MKTLRRLLLFSLGLLTRRIGALFWSLESLRTRIQTDIDNTTTPNDSHP